jgi:uncharacterized protein (TIGR00255 family)
MLKSMTAYGRAVKTSSLGRFVVEIQSLNRKYLEIQSFLPKEFASFDAEIRKQLTASVFRGQVTVRLSASFERESPVKITPNLALARQMKQGWETLCRELQMELDSTSLMRFLSQEEEVFLFEREFGHEEDYKAVIKEAIAEALIQMEGMKKKEGAALQEDIENRLAKLKAWIEDIEKRVSGSSERYRQKLLARLNEVFAGNIEDDRILKEIAIYAERIDVSEEITRFHSHLKQFQGFLASTSEAACGKTLEFLLQELQREINTIGNKASDSEVTPKVVEVKGELEKIREQIQNIE